MPYNKLARRAKGCIPCRGLMQYNGLARRAEGLYYIYTTRILKILLILQNLFKFFYFPV